MSGLATFPEGIRTSPREKGWTVTSGSTNSVLPSQCRLCAAVLTRDLSLLDGERNDQVERSQASYIQSIDAHWLVRRLQHRVKCQQSYPIALVSLEPHDPPCVFLFNGEMWL